LSYLDNRMLSVIKICASYLNKEIFDEF